MHERSNDRIFAACGIASVVAMLAGVAVGAAGGRQFATITSTQAQIADAVRDPVGAAAWAGAYIEVVSFALFIAFAMWACAKLGTGVFASIGRSAATAYASVSVASLAVGDTISYRAGHGMSLDLATTLITLNEALYVCTWFLSALFLVAVSRIAITAGRRLLGWSGYGVAAATLVLTPISVDNVAQLAYFLWLAWIIGASISLARARELRAPAVAPARAV